MDPEPIRAQFTFTEEDALATIREGARNVIAKQRRFYLVVAAVALVAAVYFVVREGPSNGWTLFLGLFAAGMAFAAHRVPLTVERAYASKITAMQELGRRITFTLSGNLLYTEVEGLSEGSTLLSAIPAVEDRPGGLLLTVGPDNYVFIPDRAFAAPAERAHFFRRLRAGTPLPDADLPA